MLKPIDIQLKFTEDKKFLSLSNTSNKTELPFSKTVCKNTQLKKIKSNIPELLKSKQQSLKKGFINSLLYADIK